MYALNINGDHYKINSSKTKFCYLLNDVICILKPVDRKINLPRVTLSPHFSLIKEINIWKYTEQHCSMKAVAYLGFHFGGCNLVRFREYFAKIL